MSILAVNSNLNTQNFNGSTFSKKNFRDFQKNNIASSSENPASENAENSKKAKTSLKDKFHSLKLKAINLFKTLNTTKGITKGLIKGIASGAVTTLGIGALAKNIKQSENSLTGTISGVIKDAFNAGCSVVTSIPKLITKSPLENAKSILSITPNFYKNYMKNAKIGATIATLGGVGVLLFNVLKGKLNANHDNAEIDHYSKTGHIPTK